MIMRLSSLHISEWKNLKDFSIDLNEESFTSVFVGRNSTAKSNLLEALVVIFRDLDLGEPPAFAYLLRYTCRGKTVDIDADPFRKGSRSTRISVDGEQISLQRFSRKGGGRHLPSNIFVYYSGHSDRMLTHFQKHEDQFDRQLRAGNDEPLRPLLYVNLLHSKFALLAFFLDNDPEQLEFLRQYLRIEDLDSVLFVLRRPHWFSRDRSRRGDVRFWGAQASFAICWTAYTPCLSLPCNYAHRLLEAARSIDCISFCRVKTVFKSLPAHIPPDATFSKPWTACTWLI